MLNRRQNESDSTVATDDSAATGTFRNIVESFLLLAVAVLLFRGFAVEGFMISTGSMAPTLLGYHRRVVCPDCRFEFARGANPEHEEISRGTVQGAYDFGWNEPPLIRCPNCSLTEIPFEQLPRTEGDQLLVHKHAYEFRDPRRWEVIVFRNPEDPRQAYVKRVVGLPGESIEIRSGNVYANGVLCRKPLLVQKAMRVPVSDWSHQVNGTDPDARPEWFALREATDWIFDKQGLRIQNVNSADKTIDDWIGYRHWIRSGGEHETRVPLSHWPRELAPLKETLSQLKYQSGSLICTGVLSDIDRRSWLGRSDSKEFQAAINQLYEKTHITGVVDESGYNAVDSTRDQNVDEFALVVTLQSVSGRGQFAMRLKNSSDEMTAILDFDTRICRLYRDDETTPLAEAGFPEEMTTEKIELEFSRIDRQSVLVWNGREMLSVQENDSSDGGTPVSDPAQFGAVGLACHVSSVHLYRDVYYTRPAEMGDVAVVMGDDEFFVLGDNSPVSVDSRFWSSPGVPRRALIGKPVVVHLPSSSHRMTWKDKCWDIRLPDFSRVRWIR